MAIIGGEYKLRLDLMDLSTELLGMPPLCVRNDTMKFMKSIAVRASSCNGASRRGVESNNERVRCPSS